MENSKAVTRKLAKESMEQWAVYKRMYGIVSTGVVATPSPLLRTCKFRILRESER